MITSSATTTATTTDKGSDDVPLFYCFLQE